MKLLKHFCGLVFCWPAAVLVTFLNEFDAKMKRLKRSLKKYMNESMNHMPTHSKYFQLFVLQEQSDLLFQFDACFNAMQYTT